MRAMEGRSKAWPMGIANGWVARGKCGHSFGGKCTYALAGAGMHGWQPWGMDCPASLFSASRRGTACLGIHGRIGLL